MGIENNAAPGHLYQDSAGNVWRVLAYQPNPTVILEPIYGKDDRRAPQHITHAVGCLNAAEFKRLKSGSSEDD